MPPRVASSKRDFEVDRFADMPKVFFRQEWTFCGVRWRGVLFWERFWFYAASAPPYLPKCDKVHVEFGEEK